MKRVGIFLSAILLQTCTGSGKLASGEVIYQVNSLKVNCTGVAPATCLQVRKGENPDPGAWQNFYGNIEGFEYEAGFRYKLVVREIQLPPEEVPADASSIRYSLVRILEKNWDPSILLNDIWVARTISGEDVDDAAPAPTLEFNLSSGSYQGNDGCNSFRGSIVSRDEEKLELRMAASTRKACPRMETADRFNRVLTSTHRYRIDEGTLVLFDEEDREIMVLKKVD